MSFDRRKHKLREYFQRFPNAEVCIDKFHVVQLLSRALNKTRFTIMNKYPEAYNKLKKYWKLLLLDSDKLKVSDFRYCRCYKAMLSSQNIVDRLLAIDPLLKQTYYMQTSILTLTSDKFKDGVINCLTYGYNNGFIEGCNNKIKVLKRVSFGLAQMKYAEASFLPRRIHDSLSHVVLFFIDHTI